MPNSLRIWSNSRVRQHISQNAWRSRAELPDAVAEVAELTGIDPMDPSNSRLLAESLTIDRIHQRPE